MKRIIEGALTRIVRTGLKAVPTRHLSWSANVLLDRIGREFSDDEAIVALLRLDQKIYKLEGPASIRRERGVHPKHRLTNYYRFFVDRLRAGERVLDAGCGKGEVAFNLAERAAVEIVGVDFDPEWIDFAVRHRSHSRVTYVLGDLYKTIPDGPFGAIVLSNVLEHLTGRAELLRHLQATVTPSRMLIRVPLFERDWRVPLKKELGIEWRLDPTHETEYTIESFQAEMASAGLVIREMQVRWGEIWAVVAADSQALAGS